MSNDRSYLESLQDYYARHRALPSYASIGGLLGLKSKSSVAALVARLKLAGYLESTPDRRLAPTRRFFARPLADAAVRAGLPERIEDSAADALTIDDYLIEHPSQTVLVRVKGDSMVDAGILEGDIVVVRREQTARDGEIVVALAGEDETAEEATVKRFFRENGRIRLQPENESMEPIYADHVQILGIVTGVFRSL